MATPNSLLRYLHGDPHETARHQRDIPKRKRQRRVVEPTRPLTDVAALGHAPRPRKARRRG